MYLPTFNYNLQDGKGNPVGELAFLSPRDMHSDVSQPLPEYKNGMIRLTFSEPLAESSFEGIRTIAGVLGNAPVISKNAITISVGSKSPDGLLAFMVLQLEKDGNLPDGSAQKFQSYLHEARNTALLQERATHVDPLALARQAGAGLAENGVSHTSQEMHHPVQENASLANDIAKSGAALWKI